MHHRRSELSGIGPSLHPPLSGSFFYTRSLCDGGSSCDWQVMGGSRGLPLNEAAFFQSHLPGSFTLAHLGCREQFRWKLGCWAGGGQQAVRVYYDLDFMVSCGVSVYLENSVESVSLLLSYFPRHKFISKMPETMKPMCP